MAYISSNTTNASPAVSIQIWVAGRDIDQAMGRRQAARERLNRRSVTHVGEGSGRFFYDLWRERTGVDPLASQGDCIVDSECHLATQDVSPTDLAALTRDIVGDLENALGFPVAVEVEVVPVDEDPESEIDPEGVPDPEATMSVTITVREHATILAALRYVARHGGFRHTIEANIATNCDQWDMMVLDEIDALGDRFNMVSDPVPDARLSARLPTDVDASRTAAVM